ncbi:MAG: hypothetical protein KBB54_01220 [Candidatus Pacebacteria bacterium]|nr:hypothetical protein [Candidatus Paceibacterota bacterium]MBP9818484.1 hypothetical protein [Candidatus Paceibacterota bacterium]
MLYTEKKNIDDLIIEILSESPNITGPTLLDLIKVYRANTTKQAMYYALEHLLNSEVVVKVGIAYSISNIWKLKLQNNLIKNSSDLQSILALHEGESISLKFPSLLTADFYWAHLFTELTEWIPEKHPIFFYLAHEWFLIGRESVEKTVLGNFVDKNKKAYYSISGKDALDKDFKNIYSSKNLSINTDSAEIAPEYVYINVFKDILIEVFLSKKLAEEIDSFYKNHQVTFSRLTDGEKDSFICIISKKHPIRIKVSKNTKKTTAIKRKLSKDFMIPKEFVL